MARPKRVPYKPDRFQQKGRNVVAWVREREALAIAAVVVAVLAFVLAVVFVTTRGADEDNALNALYRYRGDLKRLEQALAEYGSTAARPLTLLEIANVSLEEPLDEEGRPEEETDADRGKRLARAEKALRTLVRENPRHELHFYGLTLLGAVLEEEGRYAEATEVLRQALEAAPASLEGKIRYDIGRLYVLKGDEDAARPYLLEARARSSRKIQVPSPYGVGATEQRPAWFENAEHLLARIGTGEKRVEFPEPEPKKGPEVQKKPEVRKKPEVEKKPELLEKPRPGRDNSMVPTARPGRVDDVDRTARPEGEPSPEKKTEPPTPDEGEAEAPVGQKAAPGEESKEEPASEPEAPGPAEAVDTEAGPVPPAGEGDR